MNFPHFRTVLGKILIIIGVSIAGQLPAQTIGGNSVFNFLKLPNTPQLTALGGVNVSNTSNDIGLAFNNPALLRSSMHTQLNAVFNSYYAGIKSYHLSFGFHNQKLNTNFAWGIHYFSYGVIPETDAGGNVMGTFRATDWVMEVSASRSYLEKWNYGATLKFISSNYGQYISNGVAVDVGVLYRDSSSFFSASVLAKNMGVQLKKYRGTDPQDLPFDLEIGMSKRFEKSPFGFSFTAHHLHQFDIRYNDTTFNSNEFGQSGNNKKFSFDKIFRHVVIATDIYLGDRVTASIAYNHLRRQELNIGKTSNGLNGFSVGLGVILNKLQIHYARAYYQNNTAYDQLGLNLRLNEFFGLSKFGERIGW